MATGKVKWFNDQKGYGFITPDGNSSDVFVHHTGIIGKGHRTLEDEQRVEFETEQTQKGVKAVKVRVLE